MARTTFTDNFLVYNKGMNPLVNFNFVLRVELALDLPCKSVKAFTREMEYEYIQEGGLNDYVHMRRKPVSRPFTLEVERYAGVDYFDPLPLGAELMLPLFLIVSRYSDKFEKLAGVARTYAFTGCTVIKKVYGELAGDRSGILTDTITIAYREMVCIDTPFTDLLGGAIVGDGASTTAAWSETKEKIDRGNAQRLNADLEALRQRQKERDEINRKYREEAARQRAERAAKIQALRDELKRISDDYMAKMDALMADRLSVSSRLAELNAELERAAESISREYDAPISAVGREKERCEERLENLRRQQEELLGSPGVSESTHEIVREQVEALEQLVRDVAAREQELIDERDGKIEEVRESQAAEREELEEALRQNDAEQAELRAQRQAETDTLEAEIAEREKALEEFDARTQRQTEINDKQAEEIEKEINDKQQRLQMLESASAPPGG